VLPVHVPPLETARDNLHNAIRSEFKLPILASFCYPLTTLVSPQWAAATRRGRRACVRPAHVAAYIRTVCMHIWFWSGVRRGGESAWSQQLCHSCDGSSSNHNTTTAGTCRVVEEKRRKPRTKSWVYFRPDSQRATAKRSKESDRRGQLGNKGARKETKRRHETRASPSSSFGSFGLLCGRPHHEPTCQSLALLLLLLSHPLLELEPGGDKCREFAARALGSHGFRGLPPSRARACTARRGVHFEPQARLYLMNHRGTSTFRLRIIIARAGHVSATLESGRTPPATCVPR